MSWAGFKKNVNRATTQVMMKTGHVEKTNDRDYEVEERCGLGTVTSHSLAR
jgi:bridging integrator 3